MAQYTITLSDAENKALGYYAASQEDWINNAVHERCRLAIEEMVSQDITAKLASGQPIAGSKEEIVLASTLPSAKQRHEAALAEIAANPIINP
jgi:hypothetical protein